MKMGIIIGFLSIVLCTAETKALKSNILKVMHAMSITQKVTV